MKNLMIPPLLGLFLVCLSSCKAKENQITGTVELQPALQAEIQKSLKPEAVLYLIVRAAGQTSGPPVAVKRFTQPLVFPLQFTISSKDVMIPETPFEGNLSVTARVAQTGSATPVKPGDIEGSALPNPIAVGTEPLKITLDKIRK